MTGDGVDEIEAGLKRLIAAQSPELRDLTLSGLHRHAQGFSRENWLVEAEWEEGGERVSKPLILRRDPIGSILDTDRRHEYAVLEALRDSPVPAPDARWLDGDGTWLGRPSLVMVRIEGECDYFALNGARPLEARIGLARGIVDLLVTMQQLDWRALRFGELMDDPGPSAGLHEVDVWERILRADQLEPHPELELVASWLRAHAPESRQTVLVHGDLKPGNLLLVGDGIAAIVDWELAHLGDPLEDLGWLTNPLRAAENQVTGAFETKEIAAYYGEVAGVVVDPDELGWWNVFSNYKAAVIRLTGLRAFVEGKVDFVFPVTDTYAAALALIEA